MGRKRKSETNGGIAEMNVVDGMDEERLAVAKQCESAIEDNRLNFEEAKARYAMAKAEHKLLVARRNIAIAKSNDPAQVEDAQRLVDNARTVEMKAKAIRDEAKEAWKNSEERLAKALTEKLPLFD